jgi:hypothetical protein
MAVRFITPVETPYESQFVPMPLDFMYKALQEKQKGLDTTRGDIGSADLKIESAPWYEPEAQQYREKFSGDVSSLSSRLEKDKSGYGAIAQQLKSLNREYNTDPEFQRIIQHHAAYKKNVEPWLGKENASSLYFRGLMKQDPKTGEWGWKKGSEIEIEDIKAPIEDKTEKYITENLLNYLKPSLTTTYGEGKFITDSATGTTMWQTPDGKTIEAIDLTNKFTVDAIDKFAERMYQGNTDQDSYVKEFKPIIGADGKVVGRGYQTEEQIRELVLSTVGKGFYRKDIVDPGTTSSAGDGGGSGGLTPKELVYEVSSFGGEEQPILDFESLASADSEIKRKKTEADGLLYGAIIAANKDRAYAPMFADVFGTSDGGTKGAVESAFDGILSLKVDNLNKKGDTRTAQVLQGVLQDSSTFVKAISADPVRAFAPGGRLETDYNFNKNEVEVIKELMYSEVLGIKNSGSANSEDLTGANTFLTAYNDAKEYERITNEQNKIANSAIQTTATATKKPNAEVLQLAKIDALVNKYGVDAEFTIDEIRKNPELKFLLDQKALIGVQAEGLARGIRPAASTTEFRFRNPQGDLYAYSPKVLSAAQTAKQVKDNFAKEAKVEERKIIRETTQGDKKGAMASFSKTSLENYKNNPNELVSLLQKTASTIGAAGKDYRNKGALKEIFGSDDNPFKMDGFNKENFELSDVVFKITNTGMPVMIVTAKNKEGDTNITSGAEIMFDMENKGQQFSEIVTQMATDDDPKVRDIAASWMGAATIKKADLGVAKMFFDSGIADKAKETKKGSQLVYFEDNKNQKYGLQTTAAGQTKFGKVKEDGTLEPFLSYRNNDGIEVDPNNVESFNEMLEIFGQYKISNIGVQGTSSTSGQGGTTGAGKSPIRQGQLWTPK